MATTRRSPDDWLTFLKQVAVDRGGLCLSGAYINSKTKLRWRCAEGHEWAAIPENVKAGHWCLICGNKKQGRQKAKTIEAMRLLAQGRGGECLSSEYINNKTKLKWKCAKGHEWLAQPSDIQQGQWCPRCAGKFPPVQALAELQKLASSRGGACLSEQYRGARSKHRWRCNDGHEWEAVPYSIRAGTWCPSCAGTIAITVRGLQETACRMGGECLSESLSSTDQQVKWRCAEGHIWWAVAYHVRAGHWCPVCMAGNSERICKDIFEQMFGRAFPKSRPSWLRNSRGKQMELDGYCKELNLAFEYHGVQHYKQNNFFHRHVKSLDTRKQDDKLKAWLCQKHGVELIVIPYTLALSKVPEYVFDFIRNCGSGLTIKDPKEVTVAELVLPEKLKAMQEIAEKHDGKCLSAFYINNNTKLRWRCAEGHEWEAVPASIQQGSWCPICIGKLDPASALLKLQEAARLHGGECLSGSYEGVFKKLHWRCVKGHEWLASPAAIRRGSWCPECAKKIQGPKRLGLDVCIEAAKRMGGECLSTAYVNTDTKLRWRCAEGHEWEAIPDSVVRRGTWCPRCKGKRILEVRRRKTV
jgi:hypothetical protein